MYVPKGHFFSGHNTRRIDFPWVDGLSTDTLVLGRHNIYQLYYTVQELINHS